MNLHWTITIKRTWLNLLIVVVIGFGIFACPMHVLAETVAFTDLNQSSPSTPFINMMRERGFVNGFPDGTFRPEAGVSRAEFVAFVNRTFGYSVPKGETHTGGATPAADIVRSPATSEEMRFSDVAGAEWFALDVKTAISASYLNGYPDGTFRPHRGITRQEAAAVLNRILRLELEKTVAIKEPLPLWAEKDILALVSHEILFLDDEYFRPLDVITREEMVVSLMTIILQQEAAALVAQNTADNPSTAVMPVPSTGGAPVPPSDGDENAPSAEVVLALQRSITGLQQVLQGNTSYARALNDIQREIVQDISQAMASYLDDYNYDYSANMASVRTKYSSLTGAEQVQLENAISASIPYNYLLTLDSFF